MSFQVNVPPTQLAQLAKGEKDEGATMGEGDEEQKERKREDWRKLKELEEARKAGTAPAMQDEEGKDINPHIPQYIMQAPWYYGAMKPTLKHQRVQPETIKEYTQMETWYKRGVKEGPVATKYRKGACENCGAMTHKKKDCLERPRRLGAKFTGQDIAPDEHVQPTLDHDFDGKRDRWNGYDTTGHKKIIEEFQQIEEAKRQLKAEKLEEEANNETGEGSKKKKETTLDEDEFGEDEDKYADDMDMPGQKFETKQRITVRNLRIREDTAKYLYNLDVNSAYYDPKTRSMRENPFKQTGKEANDLPYAGDNFVRSSGDAFEMAKKQLFAWEAYEKGAEVHLQADPTKLEALAREYKNKKETFKNSVKDSILAKYGGEEHLEAPPKQLLLAQSEDYVEYSRQGAVIKGQEKAAIKSRYEEDVYNNNHTSVWGSYWKEGHWGYKCCYSFIKESYCTGKAGQQAEQTCIPGTVEEQASEESQEEPAEESEEPVAGVSTAVVPATSPPKKSLPANPMENLDKEEIESIMKQYEARLAEARKKRKKKEKKKKRKRDKKKKKKKQESSDSDSSSSSEDEDEAREKRIQEAMKREEAREKEVDRIMSMEERKRPYNVMYDLKAPTEDDLEAYRRKRQRDEDPMAQFAGK